MTKTYRCRRQTTPPGVVVQRELWPRFLHLVQHGDTEALRYVLGADTILLGFQYIFEPNYWTTVQSMLWVMPLELWGALFMVHGVLRLYYVLMGNMRGHWLLMVNGGLGVFVWVMSSVSRSIDLQTVDVTLIPAIAVVWTVYRTIIDERIYRETIATDESRPA